MRAGLLLARAFPEEFRRDYLSRMEAVCARVGADGSELRAWAWFYLAVERAELDAKRAAETACQPVPLAFGTPRFLRTVFVIQLAGGLAVAAAHSDNRPFALSLLVRALWLLPECRPSSQLHISDLPPWPLSCPDPIGLVDLIQSGSDGMGTWRYVAALLCGEFERQGQYPVSAQLRPTVASAFGKDFADLLPQQWARVGRAALEARPELSPFPLTFGHLSYVGWPVSMDAPDDPKPPRLLMDDVEAPQVDNSSGRFPELWASARREVCHRIQAARDDKRSPAPLQTEADTEEAGRQLAATEARAVIEALPSRLATCGYTGRGYRDDFVLKQLQPVFRAWQCMRVREVTPQAERIAQLMPTVWSGRRSDFPWHLIMAASAVDVNLGIRMLSATRPGEAHNHAPVYEARLAACGLGDLPEAIKLARRLIDSREKVGGVVAHLTQLLSVCSPAQERAVRPVLMQAVPGISDGVDTTDTVRSVADSLRAMSVEKAVEVVDEFFQVMAAAYVIPEPDWCADSLGAVAAGCSAERLTSLLAIYPGTGTVFAELLTRLPSDVAAQVAEVFAEWGERTANP